jgi:hypothetical protein
MYDDDEALYYSGREIKDAQTVTAAAVFMDMLAAMDVDPVDRSEWLHRFIASHRMRLAQFGQAGIGA